VIERIATMQVTPNITMATAATQPHKPSMRKTAFEFQASTLGALFKPMANNLVPKATGGAAENSAYDFYATMLTDAISRKAAKGDYLKLNSWFESHAGEAKGAYSHEVKA